ncbi:MAG: ATP-binding cassette domain-containing protein [Candidatus Absconditabacterales bacterium]|nr:ATP-binding cassette domain-containing protein [Candidatus Absconditabacterales bacterium]
MPKLPKKQPRHISLSSLTYTIDQNSILDNLTLSLLHHKTPVVGIIGYNGAGKSTLAKILSGQLKASGNIYINGDVGYMQQEWEIPDTVSVRAYLSNFIEGDREEYKIIAILDELNLDSDCMDQMIGTMSGGQKRKIQLAKLILQDKTILIMDEPTNHIDHQTKQRLAEWITTASDRIFFLVISHDRDFLNDIAHAIVEIHNGKAVMYEGNYDTYTIQRAINDQSQQRQFAEYEKKRKKMEAWIATMQERASRVDNPTLGRLIQARKKIYEREIVGKAIAKPDDYTGLKIEIGVKKSHHHRLCERTNQDIIQPDSGEILIKQCSATIYQGQKILLSGPNGTGKTTLIKRLLRHEHMDYRSPQLDIGICDQHMTAMNIDITVSDFLIELHQLVRFGPEVLNRIADQYRLRDQLRTRLKNLSHGQKVRLRFAQLARKTYNLLILDEPTNHLDIPTKERIEEALRQYTGAIVVVSHDSYFVREIMVDTVWEIKDKKLVVM